ncbi:hypothetical protein BCR41DRAFT_344369 [Lobosporangium transversale]|uniref:Uncharacterized protein n=1 Tax=Lobosporangium transversale TaxID=64571 RepID=A0A1Y2H348_9FUNG|nr:hypothetical protein BCR41DRAFT_344369 [Lobosporangium transversale]ORZ28977.1 hypothetical protein BCR41DRAFT_344369 [Lobosporangium transversale]|eukprot:XP_021886650.1 hypothetical protein BCR41DRAFT_344369 [Lobosporangium transversale]
MSIPFNFLFFIFFLFFLLSKKAHPSKNPIPAWSHPQCQDCLSVDSYNVNTIIDTVLQHYLIVGSSLLILSLIYHGIVESLYVF